MEDVNIRRVDVVRGLAHPVKGDVCKKWIGMESNGDWVRPGRWVGQRRHERHDGTQMNF